MAVPTADQHFLDGTLSGKPKRETHTYVCILAGSVGWCWFSAQSGMVALVSRTHVANLHVPGCMQDCHLSTGGWSNHA